MKLTKEEALKKIEELKKYVANEEATEKKGYIITNRYTGSEIYVSKADNIRDAVIEAVENGADLSEANLSEADLSGAKLSGANLYEANLRGAELNCAKFYGKGGTVKLKKEQVTDFLNALGFQVE